MNAAAAAMGTDSQPMQGKTVVITGATSGIGQIAAERLAQLGARIVFIARDRTRGEATLARLRSLGPGCEPAVHYADLSLIAEMKRVAGAVAASEPRIDVLVNNAGAFFARRQLTAEGLERTFATNHLSYFVITLLLLERLEGTAGARIVSTASAAHLRAKIDFADLQSAQHYRGFAVYGSSKLMNILFTRELARRLGGSGVTANCLHPGFVATRFGDNNGGATSLILKLAKRFGALTPEQGARTLIYLASSPGVAKDTGQYFCRCQPATSSARAQNDADARRLWEISAQLTGVGA
ncbi:MAG TPA: SDR family oxidoreductase [Steroidobacteraceae bacterium]|nr:SDR family oxidoreductase [Steroidobacteraceae bacterium]